MTTDYVSGSPSSAGTVPADSTGYYDVARLHRQYTDYIGAKKEEIEEQKVSRRYYHGSHWTAAELAILKKRNQPPTFDNRISRKINAIVGLLERLRQDPKAYPRTPQHEQGAEVASATLRYVLDHNEWNGKSPICALHGAVDGLGGVEYNLVNGDKGDPDLEIHIVDPDTFFYDPRSFRDGFSDARYMGVAKWVDLDMAKELVPGKDEELDSLVEHGGADLTSQADREVAWINTHEKKIRLVDHWYLHGTKWCWMLYVGNVNLMEGHSPFIDERGKSFPKYRMFSGFVDHDGDRYSFIRNMKPNQDSINHRASKALHMAHSRRLIVTKGAVDDIEVARREWAKPDGIIEVNLPDGIKPEDQSRDIAAELEFLKKAEENIENFGPNPALVGQGLEDSSGRAIALLQQAGIAELGPYLLAYKSWKGRVYRDIWNIIQRSWTAERWVRVTDDNDLAQFFQVNKLSIGQDGMPVLENALGQLDVDIILDEGPDTVNMQADSFSVLQSLGPQFMQQFPEVALELSPLAGSMKKRLKDQIQQAKSQPPPPDPKVLAMQQQMQLQAQMDQQRMQFEQQQAMADNQLEQQKAVADIQLKRDIAKADLQLKAEEMQMDYDHEHRKMMLGVETERHKADIKVDGEKKARVAQTSEPLVEANIDAIKNITDTLANLHGALTAPKRLIRDDAGRPVGVETVGA